MKNFVVQFILLGLMNVFVQDDRANPKAASECRWLQPQPYRFLQIEQQVHVVHGLSAGTFQQVVDAGDDEQLVAMFFQVEKAFVGVDHLLQVDVLVHHVGKRVAFVVLRVDTVQLLDAALVLDDDGREDAPRESAPVGDEVYLCVEAVSAIASTTV